MVGPLRGGGGGGDKTPLTTKKKNFFFNDGQYRSTEKGYNMYIFAKSSGGKIQILGYFLLGLH